MRGLSKRLQVIFDLVPMSSTVADIGTDHAYLPIALSISGKVKKVIACDINESPLKKAKENIQKVKEANIELRLGDGISPLNVKEADTIIIAGMGGDVICHILSSCHWIKNPDLLFLLQPMTSAELLRSFLTDNLFEIEKEVPVSDASKIYSVIVARFTGVEKTYKKGYEFVGEVSPKSKDGLLYIEKQHKRISECLNNIKTIETKADETKNLTEILSYIESIMEK